MAILGVAKNGHGLHNEIIVSTGSDAVVEQPEKDLQSSFNPPAVLEVELRCAQDGDEGGGENRARGDVAAVSRGARGAARRVRGAQGEQREARERGRGAAQGAERVRAAVTM